MWRVVKPFILICGLVFYGTCAFGYSPLDRLPSTSRAAIIIEDLQSHTTLQQTENQNQLFPPASTLKLATALAAKLELGDEFKFTTIIETLGNDMIIRFSGDPTLTTADLKQLFTQVRNKGITKINGNIWLDNSAFTGYERAIGTPWDVIGVCYSAPASAITLDHNCVQASIYTQREGKTRVYVPEHQPIYVTSIVKAVSKTEQEGTQCNLELLSSPNNHYQLQGCLVNRSKPLPLKFALQNPSLYSQRIVSTLLSQLKIPLNGEVKIGSPQQQGVQLATHYSEPLPKLLEVMLKKSDNLIADNLTKTLGGHFFIQAGSFSNGTEAIKQILFTKAGIDLKNMPLVDGSGLSRNNRFSSHNMAAILRYIWLHDKKLGLMGLMAQSGTDGTLKYRSSMRKKTIKDALIAKSGSVYASHNMAGYGLDKSGKPKTLFVQFVSDYFPKKTQGNEAIIAPITQFETLFYQDVIKFSRSLTPK